MEISVDRRQLLAEDEVPVGLFRCLYDTLVCCNCRPMRRSPLKTCCAASVLGSWSSKLLWIPLRCHAEGSARRCCMWQTLLRSVGWIVLAVAVPLPYYIRLLVFYVYEEDEMADRRTALDRLGLRYGVDHDLFQWLTPTHGAVLTVYVCYVVSVLSFALLRRGCASPDRVTRLISDTVADLRRLRPSVCGRLLLAHFLLPLEKFGVVCGLVVGLVYWPVALPVCLVAVACYMLPLMYVTGRLLVHTRCRCLSTLPLKTDHAQSVNLSDGVTSFETCCFLDAITGSDDRCSRHVTSAGKKVSGGCGRVGETLKSRLIGLVLVVLVWSLLLLYAEAIGFGVEVVVMTSLGVVLNSGSDAARRVVLVAWGLVYAVACYRAAVGSYADFSHAVFAAMKRRLVDRLLSAATLREDSRRNTAFKYFTADEIRRLTAGEASTTVQHSESPDTRRLSLGTRQVSDDSIEYQADLLHWKITSLSLFIDRKDTAYIPRHLFARLCHLDVPGGPRSGTRVVLTAVGRLVIAGLFLLVLGLVVELSADAEMSDGSKATEQTLVTLACGALPLIIHAVFTRFTASRRCELDQFAGKVERAVLSYCHSWPVFDLAFHRQTGNDQSMTSRPEGGGDACEEATELKSASPRRTYDNQNAPASGSRDVSRSHVDLLITIRDDDDDDNGEGTNQRTDHCSSPVGSGNSRFDRQTPADESTVTSVSGHAGRQSVRHGRPRSVTIDQDNSGSRKSESGFLLRKQNSASTIPLRNLVKPEVVSCSQTSSSMLVIDMVGDGDVTAMAAEATEDSTRSLPSCNDNDDDDDDDRYDVPDTHHESAL